MVGRDRRSRRFDDFWFHSWLTEPGNILTQKAITIMQPTQSEETAAWSKIWNRWGLTRVALLVGFPV
jgi:hypothetical protein